MKELARLNADIDDLDAEDKQLGRMTVEEMNDTIERVVSGSSIEAHQIRRERKAVRYKLYRLRTEKEGGPAAGVSDEFRERFEADPLFQGWRWFARLWDVALDDPCRIVTRDHSEGEEWEQVVRSKFPQIDARGRVSYPDITVKRRVENEARRRGLIPEE